MNTAPDCVCESLIFVEPASNVVSFTVLSSVTAKLVGPLGAPMIIEFASALISRSYPNCASVIGYGFAIDCMCGNNIIPRSVNTVPVDGNISNLLAAGAAVEFLSSTNNLPAVVFDALTFGMSLVVMSVTNESIVVPDSVIT